MIQKGSVAVQGWTVKYMLSAGRWICLFLARLYAAIVLVTVAVKVQTMRHLGYVRVDGAEEKNIHL